MKLNSALFVRVAAYIMMGFGFIWGMLFIIDKRILIGLGIVFLFLALTLCLFLLSHQMDHEGVAGI